MVSARVRAEPGEAAASRPLPAGGGPGWAAPRLGVATRVGALSQGVGPQRPVPSPGPEPCPPVGGGPRGVRGPRADGLGLGAGRGGRGRVPHDRYHIRAGLRALPSGGRRSVMRGGGVPSAGGRGWGAARGPVGAGTGDRGQRGVGRSPGVLGGVAGVEPPEDLAAADQLVPDGRV